MEFQERLRSRTGLKVVSSKCKYSITDPGIGLIPQRSQNMVSSLYFISFLVWALICPIILGLVYPIDTNIKVTLSPVRINHYRGIDIYI